MQFEDLEKEKQYLNLVLGKLEFELKSNQLKLSQGRQNLNDMLKYLSDNYYNMDSEEKASTQALLEDKDFVLVESINRDMILKRQLYNPYFGRIDFKADDELDFNQYYIGISSLTDYNVRIPYICDWRAPVSSMYYDFEVGRCSYLAPVGKVVGEINLKRQYKISNGELQYCFDSNLTIGDDILQETLSKTTDTKMKNIVSTIQKEQNSIIRSDIYKTLIVQGMAGSGKTSIALHRVAFLLYKYKNSIKSKDILIISPNKIFSDYISNVLPELGEQNVGETTFGEIARDELKGIIVFEDRFDMLEDIIAGNLYREREIKVKSSFDFYLKLKKYLYEQLVFSFEPKDIIVGEVKITAEKIKELYLQRYTEREISLRIEWISEYISDEIIFENGCKTALVGRIKKQLYKMFKTNKILEIYEDFLNTLSMSLQFTKSGACKYEDVAPILFIKDFVLGINSDKKTKYLIVDEMQDYSPIHFSIFNKLFPCPKTILGDIYQCAERKVTTQDLNNIREFYGDDGILLFLNKSYRSTVEIAIFAQRLIGLKGVENVNRRGKNPEILEFKTYTEEIDNIVSILKNWNDKNYSRCAIICKNEIQAENLYKELKDKTSCSLLNKQKTLAESGNIITSCALSKGLEFDSVLIPFCSEDNYKTDIDRNILFISCTRALHELYLTSHKPASKLILGV